MANQTLRGFRWISTINGSHQPRIMHAEVADNYGTQLVAGDLITRVSTGYVQRNVGSEGTQTDVLGLMVGVVQRYDSVNGVLFPGKVVPANTRWGSSGSMYEKRTIISYIPMVGNIFEADVSTALGGGFVTQAGMDTLKGENVDSVVESVTGNFPACILDASTHATTSTLQFRIKEIPDISVQGGQQDFTTTLRMKIRVICNRAQDPSTNTTGI